MRGCHSRSPPLDEPHEHDEDDGSNEADEKFAQEAASHGEAADEKTSEPATCNSQQDVYEKAIASALHDLSGRPARERAKREFHDQPHGVVLPCAESYPGFLLHSRPHGRAVQLHDAEPP